MRPNIAVRPGLRTNMPSLPHDAEWQRHTAADEQDYANPQQAMHEDRAPHRGDDVAVPRPLSLREVAELFGRTPRTIRNWVRAGLLTPLPLPRGPYFCREQLMELCENKSGCPTK